jgi:hypothetical protein
MTNCGAINGRPQIVELGPEFIHPERNIPIYAYHPTTVTLSLCFHFAAYAMSTNKKT